MLYGPDPSVSIAQDSTPTLASALAAGYSVIPVRLDKKPHYGLLPKGADGKATWKVFQDRRPDAEEIATWDKARPPAYGIVTGRISGIVTLDFDGDLGRKLAGEWNVQAHRKTGSGGFHWDVRYPGNYVPTLNGKAKDELGDRWPGLDLKGDGGYAVAFGRNQTGRYEWLRAIAPDAPELVPAEVWEFLRRCTTRPAAPSTNGQKGRVPVEHLIAKALTHIPVAGRNDAGLWLACQLRDNRYLPDDARPVMLEYRNRCPETNAKGDREKYTEEECLASLYQAYARPARDPWKLGASVPAGDASSDAQAKQDSLFVVKPNQPVLYDDEVQKIIVCSHLRIEARTRDGNGFDWGRLLVWTDPEGQEKTWSMPMELLAGECDELRKELLRGGLVPGTHKKAHHLLPHYILSARPEAYALCVPKLGWSKDAYVFPDTSISQNSRTTEKVVYQGPAYIQHYYATAGTLDDWREQVSALCRGNSRLVFCVGMALAAPLLDPLGIEGGGFQLTGDSTTGKSTAQIVAGSVLGGGNGDKGFCRSWRNTSNALEGVALIHNDGLLILDELREMSDPKEVETCVYMLANGSAKGRMTRTGSVRPALTWRILFLSSGEYPLSAYAAGAGRKIKAGAEVRLINLPADAGAGLGLFESLHGEESPRAFSEKIKRSALAVYGTPIREFLKHFIADKEDILKQARQYMANFINAQLPKGAAAEVARALKRFAVVAVAGEIATQMGIVDWEPDTSAWAATRCFKDWLKYRGGIGKADLQAAVRQVQAFLEAHGASRFQSVIVRNDKFSGDEIQEKVFNRAGYWKYAENGEKLFLVSREVFHREVCDGYSAEDVAQEPARQNFLIPGDGRNLPKKESVPNEGQQRFYVIRARIME